MLQKWSQNAEERCRIIAVHLRQGDAIAAIAHLYTAMRSLHTHMDTHNLHSDTIAAGAYTYTLIRSLPLHTPTQLYDRCHCTNLHSDTIAVSTHTHTHSNTAMQSLFFLAVSSHTYSDIQSLHEHTNLHSETIAAAIKSPLKHDCRCKHASVFFSTFQL